MTGFFQQFSETRPYAWFALAALTLGVVWLGGVVVRLNRRPQWAPSLARVIAVPSLGLGAALLAIIAGIVRARADLFATIQAANFGDSASRLAHDMSAQTQLVFLICCCLGSFLQLLVIAALIVVAVAGQRARRPIAPAMLMIIAAALPALVTAPALLFWDMQVIHSFAGIGSAPPDQRAVAISLGFAIAYERLVIGRALLAAAVAVACGLAAWAALRATRAGLVVSRKATGAAAIVFLLGVAAVLGTRGHAADAAQLLPIARDYESPGLIDGARHAPRIVDDRCDALPGRAPILFVSGGKLSLDGHEVDPDGVGTMLRALRDNFSLLHPGEPWKGDFYVLTTATEPSGPIAAGLAAALRVRWVNVRPVLIRVTPQPTHTLGMLERKRLCTRSITLAADGKPMGSFATWGDVVAAAADGPLRLAP